MKFTLLILFVFISFPVFSQTKDEAQDFIKKYLEAYPQNNGKEAERTDIHFITDDEGDLFMSYSNYVPYLFQDLSTFMLKDVQSIVIDKTTMMGKNIILHVKLKPGAKCQYQIPQFDTKEFRDKIDIIIGNASLSDNIPERLKKAIEHLVNLSGGSISKDKF